VFKRFALPTLIVLATVTLYSLIVVGIFFSSGWRDLVVVASLSLGFLNFITSSIFFLLIGAKLLSTHKTEWKMVDMKSMLGKRRDEGVDEGSFEPIPNVDLAQEKADEITEALFNPTNERFRDNLS